MVGGTIVFGEEGAEPLLRVTALESGGFEVDPRNEELKRLPAVLLKSAGTMQQPGELLAEVRLRKTSDSPESFPYQTPHPTALSGDCSQ